VRLEKRSHLGDDPVRLGILCREPHQRPRVENLILEVRGTLAASLRIDSIAHRIGPGRFQERLDFLE
jgi:hypothetical protein